MAYEKVEVYSPRSLAEALELLSQKRELIKPVAGGTDIMVMLKDGVLKEKELLNLSFIPELSYIKESENRVLIGAATKYREIRRSPLINAYSPILIEAIRQIGSPQIQNLGTIGGNLGTASPAGDSIPPLYILNSRVKLQKLGSSREVQIDKFFLGPRKTVKESDELITEISIEKMDPGSYYFFEKLGLRSANAISIVSAAAILSLENNTVKYLRLSLGAVAPTVIRAVEAEELAKDKELNEELIDRIAKLAAESTKPITDIRGTAEYRKKATYGIIYEALYKIMKGYGKKVEYGFENTS
ncbi:MAG: FAD binding domain-containing protein [Nitrososphaeria archaeon]